MRRFALWLGLAAALFGAASTSALEPASDAPGDVLMRSGLDAYQRGALELAARDWLAAAQRYDGEESRGLQAEALARAGQALSAQGLVAESQATLERALELATRDGDSARIGAILAALAQNYVELGETDRAAEAIDEALQRARGAQARGLEAVLLHGRGDLLAANGDPAGAEAAYAEAEKLAANGGDATLAAQAAAGAARASIDAGRTEVAGQALAGALERARALPDSDTKAQVLIHLGQSYEQLLELDPSEPSLELGAAAAYRAAIEVAEGTGAERSAAFALGSLGHLYERRGRNAEAISLTERAVFAAQTAQAPEALYRWDWQLGRLLWAEGESDRALHSYRRAVRTLAAVRGAGGGAGLAFGESVEPVYFGLVDVLLQQAARTADPDQQTALLSEARDHLEDLKSAELREYFHDACLTAPGRTEAGTIPGAVIVYPVILPDRTELIVSREDGLTSIVAPIRAEDLNREIHTFRGFLQKRTTREYRAHAARLYDWLMRPLEAALADQRVDVLVFVPGGALRTIPMAALYDSETRQFLIEKYPLAVIPALNLTDPRPIDRQNVRTLLAGLTQPVQGFAALEAVGSELDAIGEILGGSKLVDDDFVVENVERALDEEHFGIVHIATHGQFRADASESFLLTYDGRLGVERLGVLIEKTRFRDQPIELLTLSACETAVGDDQAALGLAGVAIRAGARSALATLWTVNDQAAGDLVAEFYRQLARPDSSRAEALQQAQVMLLNSRPYRHPGYWAPFLLISNWM